MAVFNEPTKWQTSLVNSGDANIIPQNTPAGTGEASFNDGFPQITQVPIGAGGIAPDRKDFNGLFKILGDWLFYIQNGGVSTYSESFDYVAGRVVSYNDNIYKCIQANGVSSTVVAPDSDTTYWQRIDNFVRSVNGVNADAGGNVQTGFPSSTFINVDFSTNPNFTAPANGFLNVSCKPLSASDPSSFGIIIDNRTVNHWMPIAAFGSMIICTPVRKGETCHLSYSNSAFDSARFIYAEGEI